MITQFRSNSLEHDLVPSEHRDPEDNGELAGLDASMGTTLGAVALDRKAGRISDVEITVYKAMGLAMEDMVAANLAYQRAKREGGGGVMAW